MRNRQVEPFAPAVIRLLQGVVHYDDSEWEKLCLYQTAIRDYLGKIGLDLTLDENRGYGFISQISNDDLEFELPRLVRRQKLTHTVTVLCVLLRERLDQHESQIDSGALILDFAQITDMARLYLPDQQDERDLERQIERAINQLIDMGLMRIVRNRSRHYEVRPVLRARVSAEELDDLKALLIQYSQEDTIDESDD